MECVRVNKIKYGNRNILKNKTYRCTKECCEIKLFRFIWTKDWKHEYAISKYKAGIFIYDSVQSKVLLVQSCGSLWGAPKGTVYKHESISEAASREVKEETNIDIDVYTLRLQSPRFLKTRSYYFKVDIKECDVSVQSNLKTNDVSGLTWIKIECLSSLVNKAGKYMLTNHTKRLIKEIFNFSVS